MKLDADEKELLESAAGRSPRWRGPLDAGTTKNREGRVFHLTPELHQLLKEQRAAADEIQRQRKMIVQDVFFHRPVTEAGALGHWAGKPISECGFYQAWRRDSDGRRLPGEHPARLPADRHPQNGPSGHSGTCGHEIEWPQDSQGF